MVVQPVCIAHLTSSSLKRPARSSSSSSGTMDSSILFTTSAIAARPRGKIKRCAVKVCLSVNELWRLQRREITRPRKYSDGISAG